MAMDGSDSHGDGDTLAEYHFSPDFKEYVLKEQLKWSLCKQNFIPLDHWVFWSEQDHEIEPSLSLDNCADFNLNVCAIPKVRYNIRRALQKFMQSHSFYGCLVQFWAATRTLEGRTLLTTRYEPFALGGAFDPSGRVTLCNYRMEMCRKYNCFYADAESGEELGLPGRVFLHQFPESNLKVEYYTTKEYPQRDLALRCGIQGSCALSVFEHSSQTCVGVLEIVSLCQSYWHGLDEIVPDNVNKIFQEFGLQCFNGNQDCLLCGEDKLWKKAERVEGLTHAYQELRTVLRSVCQIHKLPLAMTWVPCCACNGLRRLEVEFCSRGSGSRDSFLKASKSSCLRKGLVFRRALSSLNMLYCSNISNLSLDEYPLVPYARLCKLSGWFTICLQNVYTGNGIYVLEFFLSARSKDNVDILTTLSFILGTMEKNFQTFRLASGKELGELMSLEVVYFQNDQKIQFVQSIQATRDFSRSSIQSSVQSSPSVANTGQGLHDANMVTNKAKYDLNCDPFSDSDPSFVQSSTRVANARPGFQDADMVTIKAKYASIERVLKLSLPCRLVELREEVAIWLMLEAGTYNVGYKDEEDGFVLIACDEDLQAYMHDSISQGNTSPMVLLEPKEPATNFNPNLNRHRSSSYRCPIKLNLCMDDILNETNKTNDLDQTTGPGMDPKPAARMVHPVHNKAFHSLEEFDEGNRSCKKQCLDGHNRRRREPQPEPLSHPRPTISHHFSMLHVLDLSNTEIKSLPQSFSRLVALQKLYLRNCECLMELPPEIGELTNLEVLDLEGTEILCLPKEIAKLVKLTCLRVSFYGYANQTVIPRKVLSNLSRLNELIIDVTPYGEWWDIEVEVIIDDLCSLKELRALKLYLPTAKLLEELTFIVPSLVNFRFTVGRCEEHFISRLPRDVEEEFNNQEKLEKGLKYVNGDRIPNEITKVFNHVNAFFLQCHWTANSLSEFGHENLNEVKFCLVMECNEFRTIIDSEQFYQGNHGRAEYEDLHDFGEAVVLGSLERLIVCYMKNMESIWKGPVGKGSMSSLKSLALHTCPNLTTLFTIDMLSNLINLEELLVEDCPKIDSLVSLKNSCSKSGPFLPNLKKISLLELPGLVSISSGLCIAPKLERMVIFYCPKLEKLSSMDISSTNLKVIKGEEEWWYALKWYESDVSTEHEGYLTSLFIPLRTDGDLFAQLTEDYIAAYDQGKFGSYK